MKIIGTYEEICAMNSFLLNNHPVYCQYQQPWIDLDGGHYSGKWRGFDVEFGIQKKPVAIGVIMPQVKFLTNLARIADKHGGLLFATGGIPGAIDEYKCEDGTTICVHNSFAHLRRYKFDKLWMDSLPSNWEDFDLCIAAVGGDRTKIHFYNELDE